MDIFNQQTSQNAPPPKMINPFKRTTAIDHNCMAKAVMALVGGTGFGFLIGLFMNAVEMRDYDPNKSQKQSTRTILKMDFKRISGMAKGFGIFGFFFSLFECQLEKLRARDDSLNSFYSGMFTTMIITSEALGPKGLLLTGAGGGVFGMIMHKVQGNWM